MSMVKWTKEQLQAIEKTGNNILVAAAAGSGKTAVLVERIISKIINEKVDIDKILIVTFTNAAASEMKERILEAIYKKIEEEPNNIHIQRQINLIGRANICTIDSFCLDVVRSNFYETDISPNFRIADIAELELIKQETLEELFEEKYEIEDKSFLNLLETYTTYIGDEPLKEIILNIYNFIQSNPFPNRWLEEQIEKYNLGNTLKEDFSKTSWGNILLNNIKEEIYNSKIRLEKLKKSISKYEELIKYVLIINQDIEVLDKLLRLKTWDDIYNYSLKMSFEKWPIDRKITIEEKDITKDKRNEIRKDIKKTLEEIDCDSKQANEDINNMYKTLKDLKQIIYEYDKLLKRNKEKRNIVDFNDIEHMALKILLKQDKENNLIPTNIALKYKEKFTQIAIDEYQDSNLVQESILTSISNNNIFMVGDVKQSIYKFRQARPELFLEKYEKYADVEENATTKLSRQTKIQLFKNFRSRKNILDTTNLIFNKIMSKKLGDIDYSEDEYLNLGALYEEIPNKTISQNTKVYVIENNSEIDEILEDENAENEEKIESIELEAKFVAKKIKQIIDEEKLVFDKRIGYRRITYKDIVILLRSTKDKANVFEKELANLNIPTYSDTSLEYLNSIEIQTIMSLLKVIDNPMQDIPLVCVLRSMIGEFTDNELIQIRLKSNTKDSFYTAMKLCVSKENLCCKEKLKNKIVSFFDKIELWRKEASYLDLDELIWKIYIDSGYYNYVSLMPDGILRQANLKLLFEKAKQYEDASFKGLYNFINFMEKVRNNSGDLSAAKLISENENVVRIMSIHKSKGLEFPLVFLCNSNKKFNVQDLNNPLLLHQDLGIGANYIQKDTKLQYSTLAKQAIKIKAKEEIISEEMRILYVALTRAKETLIITGIQKDFEKALKEKEEALSIYANNEKINPNIIKKYKSYLDWIELVNLNNDNTIIDIKKISKEEVLSASEDANKEVINAIEDFERHIKNDNNIEELKNKIEWEYKDIELSRIESKSSVSKLKENIKENKLMKLPRFLEQEELNLTGAQKGTLIHLCMQHLNVKEEYSKEKVEKLIKDLRIRNIINDIQSRNIDINKVLNFTKSNIWKELKNAKLVEREKTFYINISADEIYHNNIQDKIVVQGVIDLFYINSNDQLVLIDYKTDYINKKEELIEKYTSQLELYKKALEEVLDKKVDKIYIYSTYLNQEIELKNI